ncbi:hypothetical protein ACCD10_22990 [Pseudomonas sp. Pseusp122]|uniref:hypothetical protein n=1 Tax=unclassified Pseudomonas TaxID=196821 RepID=UPI0039A413C0
MNTDFVFMTHLLRSLGLPIYSAEIHSPRPGSRPYVAALHLRQYQAIVFEDGHDFFSKHQQKHHLIYQVLSYLLKPPYGYDIVLCGTHVGLTEVGLRALDMGIEVVFLDLKAMECGEAYQHFVAETLKALALSRIPTYLIPPDSPSAIPGPLQQGAMDVESDFIRMMRPVSIPIRFPEFVTPQGIDLCELNAHTKGLVGKTVSALGSFKALTVFNAEAGAGTGKALEKVPLLHKEVTGGAGVADVRRANNVELDARSLKPQDSQLADARCAHAPKPRATSGRGFETYLKPIADETLGSWLSRNACSPTITTIHDDFLRWCTELTQGREQSYDSYSRQLLPHAGRTPDFAALPTSARLAWEREIELSDEGVAEQLLWDPAVLLGSAGHGNSTGRVRLEHDTLYQSPAFLDVFPAQMQHRIPIQFLLPGDATHPRENRKYCAQCIADDVAAFRAPALRRAWRKRGAAVCTYHRHPVLLQRLDRSSLSELTGSWLAYSQHTQREAFDHGTGMISRSARGFQEVSSECGICRIVGRIQNWVENSPTQPTATQPSKYALYFLLGYFLYQPNSNSDGGIARWFFSSEKGSKVNAMLYEKPTVYQLVANIETGSPKSLAMAYLLVGCAFELIGPREHGFLKSVLTFTDSPFPSDRAQIKTLARCFQDYHCVAMWESAQCNLSEEDLIHVEWLLKTQ